MTTDLAIAALKIVIQRCRPPKWLMHYSKKIECIDGKIYLSRTQAKRED